MLPCSSLAQTFPARQSTVWVLQHQPSTTLGWVPILSCWLQAGCMCPAHNSLGSALQSQSSMSTGSPPKHNSAYTKALLSRSLLLWPPQDLLKVVLAEMARLA